MDEEMGFGEALARLLGGQRMRRRSADWVWVVPQPGYPNGLPVNAQTAQVMGLPEAAVVGTTVRFRRYLMVMHGDGSLGPWDVAQDDVLATDWEPHA